MTTYEGSGKNDPARRGVSSVFALPHACGSRRSRPTRRDARRARYAARALRGARSPRARVRGDTSVPALSHPGVHRGGVRGGAAPDQEGRAGARRQARPADHESGLLGGGPLRVDAALRGSCGTGWRPPVEIGRHRRGSQGAPDPWVRARRPPDRGFGGKRGIDLSVSDRAARRLERGRVRDSLVATRGTPREPIPSIRFPEARTSNAVSGDWIVGLGSEDGRYRISQQVSAGRAILDAKGFYVEQTWAARAVTPRMDDPREITIDGPFVTFYADEGGVHAAAWFDLDAFTAYPRERPSSPLKRKALKRRYR